MSGPLRQQERRAPRVRQRGQAMVEMAIASAFLLVPLLLCTFLLGKYVAIKSATVQAARYAAFERTVHAPACGIGDMFCGEELRGIAVSTQSDAEISSGATMRVFSSGLSESLVIDAQNDGLVGVVGYQNSPLYTDHARNELLDGPLRAPIKATDNNDLSPALPDTLVAASLGTINALTLNTVGFQLNAAGFVTSTVAVTPDNPMGPAPFDTLNLAFSQSASVLSDSWSGNDEEYTRTQVSGVVPTTLFAPITDALDVVNLSLPLPLGIGVGLLPDLVGLELGKVVVDDPAELPADRLGPVAP